MPVSRCFGCGLLAIDPVRGFPCHHSLWGRVCILQVDEMLMSTPSLCSGFPRYPSLLLGLMLCSPAPSCIATTGFWVSHESLLLGCGVRYKLAITRLGIHAGFRSWPVPHHIRCIVLPVLSCFTRASDPQFSGSWLHLCLSVSEHRGFFRNYHQFQRLGPGS